MRQLATRTQKSSHSVKMTSALLPRPWLRKRPNPTLIFFESPKRVHETLTLMAEVFGADREGALCRELTKTYEEVIRGSLAELVDATEGEVLGEITLVVAPGRAQGNADDHVEAVLALAAEGMRLKDAAAEVAEATGLRKNELYRAALARTS